MHISRYQEATQEPHKYSRRCPKCYQLLSLDKFPVTGIVQWANQVNISGTCENCLVESGR